MNRPVAALVLFLVATPLFAADGKPRPHGLPPVDLKQTVIWGSTAEGENGFALSFGGMDQSAADGIAHTRVKENGNWRDIYADLRKGNPLQALCDHLRGLARVQKELVARTRSAYFENVSGSPRELLQ